MRQDELIHNILERFKVKIAYENNKEIGCYCPFHDDEKVSFSINKYNGKWHCFTEEIGGRSIVSFVAKLRNCSFDEARKIIYGEQKFFRINLIEKKHIKEKKRNDVIIELPKEFKKIESIKDCPKYLLNRLEWKTIKFFKLGKCEEGYFKNRIIIPIILKKKIKGFVARDYSNSLEKPYIFPLNFKVKETLFNYDNLDFSKRFIKNKEVILVEGPFDAMSLWEKGFKNALCIFGISISNEQIKLLIDKNVRNIVFCFDNDSNKKENWGYKASLKFASKLKYYFDNIYIMKLPEGKDPDECSRLELKVSYKNKEIIK